MTSATTAGAAGDQVSPATGRGGLWAAAGRWPGVGMALVIFSLLRLGQLSMLAWLDPDGGQGIRELLLEWDGGWFLRVATEGYPVGYDHSPEGAVVGNGLAFFPVYPMLIRAGAALGASPETAALTVSWVAAAVAAVALHLLGTTLYDRRVGYSLVAICCAQPMSVVLSMAYSEAVFLALVAGMLVAAHRGRWLPAGLLGLGAALTRPTGAAAAVALAVAAALAIRGAAPGQRWRPAAAAAVALAGVPAYLGWVAWRVGELDAWFTIQSAGWGTSFDGGVNTLRFLAETLAAGDGWVPVSTAWLLLVATAAVVVALAARPWPPLAVYGVLAFVLVVGQAGFYHSKVRLLVAVLLILLPAACAAARARPRLAVAGLVGYAAFGLWYGAHMVAVWPYTI